MRRTRLARFLGTALLAALLLPQAALAGSPAATTAGTPSVVATTATTELPRFRLGCALVVPNPLAATADRRIVCRWVAPDGVDVRAYRVWRIVDLGTGRPRHLLATIAADQPLRYADHGIKRGHSYTYRVVALGADGSRVARSNRVTVHVGRRPQVLRFNCAYVIDTDRQGVACHWSATTRRAAVRYVLYRSVDGGPREVVDRVRINGHRRFFDTDVAPGQTIRYAVVAKTRTGRVVAIGGPDTVLVPAGSLTAGAR
jgi:hypothetical protein